MEESSWINNRSKITHELGRIETLSPQGDNVFAVVRRVGTPVYDVDNHVVYIGTSLFGNELSMPEDELTLAELLLPTNIDPKMAHCNYQLFIGQKVRVEMKDGRPLRVIVTAASETDGRVIPRNFITEARLLSDDLKLNNENVSKVLKQKGYTSAQIDAIIKETYSGTKVKGQVVSYGDFAAYHKTSVKDSVSELDLSSSASKGIVPHLPLEKLKNRLCHQHPAALSAK